MKWLLICLCAFYITTLSADIVLECYYTEPIEQKVDGNFFQKLVVQGYDESFKSIEKHLRDHIPFSYRFQFKYPLRDKCQAKTFEKVMQIKAQEAHRFVPVIELSRFIAHADLGFIREIKIKNNGPKIQEHVLFDYESAQVIFIEEWVIDSNNIQYPGSFAAINGIIEEEGIWYLLELIFIMKNKETVKFTAKCACLKKPMKI